MRMQLLVSVALIRLFCNHKTPPEYYCESLDSLYETVDDSPWKLNSNGTSEMRSPVQYSGMPFRVHLIRWYPVIERVIGTIQID